MFDYPTQKLKFSHMNPAKRHRADTRQDVGFVDARRSQAGTSSCDPPEGHRILAEYFLHIAHVTGIHDDFQVMSDAWTITVRMLQSSGAIDNLTQDSQSTTSDEVILPRKYKAVVVAACALAVDVCGDFEASFARSAVAWGTFFMDQIQSSPNSRSAESDCMQLMRMKMITGRALRWDIGFNNPATSFCENLIRLRDNRECCACQRMSGSLSRQHTSTLIGISLLLSSRGDSSETVALVAVLFMHNPKSTRHVPTPIHNEMHLVPACLGSLFTHHAKMSHVVESLAYVHRHSDYVKYLISEVFNPRDTSTVKTLSMIEREYYKESSGDVPSPSLN